MSTNKTAENYDDSQSEIFNLVVKTDHCSTYQRYFIIIQTDTLLHFFDGALV